MGLHGLASAFIWTPVVKFLGGSGGGSAAALDLGGLSFVPRCLCGQLIGRLMTWWTGRKNTWQSDSPQRHRGTKLRAGHQPVGRHELRAWGDRDKPAEARAGNCCQARGFAGARGDQPGRQTRARDPELIQRGKIASRAFSRLSQFPSKIPKKWPRV